jgi:hypothetical protein
MVIPAGLPRHTVGSTRFNLTSQCVKADLSDHPELASPNRFYQLVPLGLAQSYGILIFADADVVSENLDRRALTA